MKPAVFMLSVAFLVSDIAQAHAYIDPGSGSVLTTAIIGFFAAIAYTARKYFYRLKDRLTGGKSADRHRR